MVRIFERWESMEALQAHFAMPHMKTFNEAIGRIQPKSADVKLYEVARELPLPR
jgi:quinol monooxygenase YgiN